MRFTVILESPVDRDYSFGLVFVPCPVWVQGARTILNLNPESPHYQKGSVRRLIDEEKVDLPADSPMMSVVVAHAEGHGTSEDLENLVRDLEFEGFGVTVLKLP